MKLEGADDIPDVCVASQRNLERLGTWADSNLTKLNKRKGHALQLRRNKHMLVAHQLVYSCAEKDAVVSGTVRT